MGVIVIMAIKFNGNNIDIYKEGWWMDGWTQTQRVVNILELNVVHNVVVYSIEVDDVEQESKESRRKI